uniref:EGF-like domain-containing protein n=1 Tax=Stomoxys calcitrans TaxID=35570 RepID=A0A1I8Q519_STOCA
MFYRLLLLFIIFKLVKMECGEHEFKSANGSCLTPEVSEDSCRPNDCGEYMECNDLNKCQCRQGFFEYLDEEKNQSKCVFPIPLKCDKDVDCGPKAKCANKNFCVCAKGYESKMIADDIWFCEKVLPKCPLGYTECLEKCCAPAGQCVGDKCLCDAGFLPKIYEDKNIVECELMEEVDLGESAGCQQECGPNSKCLEGVCKCDEGFYASLNSSACLPKREVIAELACDQNRDICSGICCPAQSHCLKGNQCVCNPGFQEEFEVKSNTTLCVAVNSSVSELPHLHIECPFGSTPCYSKCCNPTEKCVEEKCQCPLGFKPKFNEKLNSSTCEKCPENYAPCADYCCGPNSRCQQGQCLCTTGFIKVSQLDHSLISCETKNNVANVDYSILEMFEFDNDNKSICLQPSEHCTQECCGQNAYCNENFQCVCTSNDYSEMRSPITKAINCIPQVNMDIMSIYDLKDICLDAKHSCSKLCCGPQAHCNADHECICSHPDHRVHHSAVTKAKSCEPLPMRTNSIYIMLGIVCVILALALLCIKFIYTIKVDRNNI